MQLVTWDFVGVDASLLRTALLGAADRLSSSAAELKAAVASEDRQAVQVLPASPRPRTRMLWQSEQSQFGGENVDQTVQHLCMGHHLSCHVGESKYFLFVSLDKTFLCHSTRKICSCHAIVKTCHRHVIVGNSRQIS
jgi:hypothetical protein